MPALSLSFLFSASHSCAFCVASFSENGNWQGLENINVRESEDTVIFSCCPNILITGITCLDKVTQYLAECHWLIANSQTCICFDTCISCHTWYMMISYTNCCLAALYNHLLECNLHIIWFTESNSIYLSLLTFIANNRNFIWQLEQFSSPTPKSLLEL